jgi:opacity protein-like surface antigen
MNTYKASLLGAAFLAMAASGARAADANTMSASQYAAMGYYLRADAGWSLLDWTGGGNDSGISAGVGLGYHISNNLRTDLRVDYSGPFASSGSHLDIATVTGNLYFDVDTGSAFTPYLGAGLGYGYAWRTNAANDHGLTYALMAGAAVALTDQTKLDIEYRFRDIMAKGSDPMEHQVTAGLRFEF